MTHTPFLKFEEPNPDNPEKCLKFEVPKVKELRVILYEEWFSQDLSDKSDQGTRVICSQRIRPSCLPRGSVTVRSAKALIENFRQLENVKYFLEL
jgi:hypothetical protein